MEILWLVKLLLSHLLTDFFLQHDSWIRDRRKNKFRSGYLYLHTFITAAVALLMIGWQYWIVIIIIFATHTLIDGWKSYMEDKPKYFLLDQLLHIMVILACWYFTFYKFSDIDSNWQNIKNDAPLWLKITAFTFLTWPASFLIGQLTTSWRKNLDDSKTLENAGKWIGIIERCVVLALILKNQYEAIGLLIAAKGLIRFSEKDRPEQKTEYLLIGTLISIALAMVTGLIVIALAI